MYHNETVNPRNVFSRRREMNNARRSIHDWLEGDEISDRVVEDGTEGGERSGRRARGSAAGDPIRMDFSQINDFPLLSHKDEIDAGQEIATWPLRLRQHIFSTPPP